MKKFYILYIIVTLLCSSCDSGQERSSVSSEQEDIYVSNSSVDYYDSGASVPSQVSLPTDENIDRIMNEKVLEVAASTISKWYQEGYDQGYEDGEDDVLSRNGYEGQYDDSCPYKGKKREEYEEGYAEGYEAGFYDNVADDGSDEEYE